MNLENKASQQQMDISVNGLKLQSLVPSMPEIPDLLYKLGLRFTQQVDLQGKKIVEGLSLLQDGKEILDAGVYLDSESLALFFPQATATTFKAELDKFVENFNQSIFVSMFGELPSDLDLAALVNTFFTAMDTDMLAQFDIDPAVFESIIANIEASAETFIASFQYAKADEVAVSVGGSDVACQDYVVTVPADALIAYFKDVATYMYGSEELRTLIVDNSDVFGGLISALTGTEVDTLDPETFAEDLNMTMDQLLEGVLQAYDSIYFAQDPTYTVSVNPDGIILAYAFDASLVNPDDVTYDSETGAVDKETTASDIEEGYADIIDINITMQNTGVDCLLDEINCVATVTVDEESMVMNYKSTGNNIPTEEGLVSSQWEASMIIPDDEGTMTVSGSSSSNVLDNSFKCDMNLSVPEEANIGFSTAGSVTGTADNFTLAFDSIRLTANDNYDLDMDIDVKLVLSNTLIDEVTYPQEKVVNAFTDDQEMVTTEVQQAMTGLQTILMPVIQPFMEMMSPSTIEIDGELAPTEDSTTEN